METLNTILFKHSETLNKFEHVLSSSKMSLEEVGRESKEIFQHSDENFNLKYLNPTGCHWFGIEDEMAIDRKVNFFKKFYHPDTLKVEFPNIKSFYDYHSPEIIYANYQQLYHPAENAFTVCLVFIKKLKVTCGYLSLTLPVANFQGLNKKIKRIITEELFRNNHLQEFEQLTERELEILRLVAMGQNNPEISRELFISRSTVEQHRKNINRKLHVKGIKDIMDFAYAFDLVY
ncbi:MAG TPA: helix-turn-helix transcriptional regulator [Anditalea sp.]|nr:helix-turn-helix transcriptional regulator [Anditalea sp.]